MAVDSRCLDSEVDEAVCRLISRAQADETDSLSQAEQASVKATEVPPGAWRLVGCQLVVDVTAEWAVDLTDAPLDEHGLTLTVSPVNGAYDDGDVFAPPGERLR